MLFVNRTTHVQFTYDTWCMCVVVGGYNPVRRYLICVRAKLCTAKSYRFSFHLNWNISLWNIQTAGNNLMVDVYFYAKNVIMFQTQNLSKKYCMGERKKKNNIIFYLVACLFTTANLQNYWFRMRELLLVLLSDWPNASAILRRLILFLKKKT